MTRSTIRLFLSIGEIGGIGAMQTFLCRFQSRSWHLQHHAKSASGEPQPTAHRFRSGKAAQHQCSLQHKRAYHRERVTTAKRTGQQHSKHQVAGQLTFCHSTPRPDTSYTADTSYLDHSSRTPSIQFERRGEGGCAQASPVTERGGDGACVQKQSGNLNMKMTRPLKHLSQF